jgi:peptide deformylase
MAQTMYEAPGVGLAATQVDVHERVVVIDVSEEKNDLRVLINPEILAYSEDQNTYEEGCLSVPGVYDEVDRPARVRVRAMDLTGKPYEFDAEGLLAVCVQHEIDHLNGKVFVQHLSTLKQTRLKARLRKEQRELEGLPALIESLEREQYELNHLLADGQLFAQDHVKAAQLGLRIEAIESELMQALQRWETLGNR